MRTTIEPCLCGDPECPQCFPKSDEAYARDMELVHLRHLRDMALICLAHVAADAELADQTRESLNNAINAWRGEPND